MKSEAKNLVCRDATALPPLQQVSFEIEAHRLAKETPRSYHSLERPTPIDDSGAKFSDPNRFARFPFTFGRIRKHLSGRGRRGQKSGALGHGSRTSFADSQTGCES